MSVSRYFATDRETARAQFVAACDAAGLPVAAYHPPSEIATSAEPVVEVTRIGAAGAATAVALTCGAWEDEGLCASGIQTALLRENVSARLPRETALVLVHAIAPIGLSGLDRGRNASWDARSGRQWTHAALAAAENRFASYVQESGPNPASPGQRTIPWQARLLCRIADDFFAAAERIALIDLRTGAGAYGDSEVAPCHTASDPSLRRAASLFGIHSGDAEAPTRGTPGDLASGLIAALDRSDVAAAVLEFGTYSMRSVLAPGSGRIFYPDSPDWREQVLRRTLAVIWQALSQRERG